jgi:hypothetical protein
MKTKLEKLFIELDKFGDFSIIGNVFSFINALFRIFDTRDPEAIPKLLTYFDDAFFYCYSDDRPLADANLAYLQLTITILGFPPEVFVPEFLRNLEIITKRAKNRCRFMIYQIIRSPEKLVALKKHLHLVDKVVFEQFLIQLESKHASEHADKYPHDLLIIQDLRKQLKAE